MPGAGFWSDADTLRKARRLEFRTRAFVDSLFTGEYASVFVGRGLEFSHVRGYHPGDDVRAIDWKVTARRGTPFVRRFVEERDLLVTLIVDRSGSARFGPGVRSAAEVASELAAGLAFAAARNNDRISMVLATDRVERVVPPGSGRRHAVRLLAEMLSHPVEGRGTDLGPALDLVARTRGGRALVFLISDFIQPDPVRSLEDPLRRAARAHDIVAVRLSGTAAEALPDVGWVEMMDPETGRRALVNTGSRRVRERYGREIAEAQAALALLLTQVGAELVEVDVAGDPLGRLAAFLTRRRGVRR